MEKDLIVLLQKFRATLKDEKDVANVNKELLYELLKLSRILVPTLSKFDEILLAATPGSSRIATSSSHGVDMIDVETKQCIELKTSIAGPKAKDYKCNLVFAVPPGKTLEERRQAMKIDQEKKMANNGYTECQIKDKLGNMLNVYQFKPWFLINLFMVMLCDVKTDKINLGCVRCRKCCKYHRLEVMLDFQNHKRTDVTFFFERKPVKAQC